MFISCIIYDAYLQRITTVWWRHREMRDVIISCACTCVHLVCQLVTAMPTPRHIPPLCQASRCIIHPPCSITGQLQSRPVEHVSRWCDEIIESQFGEQSQFSCTAARAKRINSNSDNCSSVYRLSLGSQSEIVVVELRWPDWIQYNKCLTVRGVFRGALAPAPLKIKNVLIFNVKFFMLTFEHFWKCTSEMYLRVPPFLVFNISHCLQKTWSV